MILKFCKLIRALIIGILWSYFFLAVANFALIYFWNFNLFSHNSWQTISYFWQSGGVIKTAKDYFFLSVLFSLPWFWLWGWKKANRINFLELFLYPLIAYNRWIIKKYGHSSSRLVLRNLKSSRQMIEEVKIKLDSIKPDKPQEVVNIREEVKSTLYSSKTKK